MEVPELLKRYEAGIRKFIWADLKNADLANANLAGINLSQARLNGANLTGVNLTKANLYKADLSQANLLGADLTDANLRKANFEGTIMPDGGSYEEWEKNRLATDFAEDETDGLVKGEKVGLATDVAEDVADGFSGGEEDGNSEEKKGIAFVSLYKRSPQRPTRIKSQYFWKKLPKKRVLTLAFGYCLFGQILTYFNAPLLAWLLALSSSIIWAVNESWFWFIPLVAAFAVIGTAGISIVALAVTLIVITGYIAGGISFVKPHKLIRDALWLGGILLCVFFLVSLLVNTYMTALGNLTLLFAGAIAGVSYGMFAFGEMEIIGYSKQQTFNAFIIATAAGLLLGWLVETIF